MKVSVQFPLLTKSENILRSLPFVVANAAPGKARGIAHSIANGVKKQRAQVRMMLDSQLPRLRRYVLPPVAGVAPYGNFYRVTLIRISAGELDTDGLAGSLKAVRDEVAAWLGVDDSARAPASWRVGQQRGPREVHAVRIEIEDDDPDQREVHRIVGGPIAKLGPIVGDVAHAPRGTEPQRWPWGLIGATPAPLDQHSRENTGDRMHAPAPRPRRQWDPRKPLEQAPLVFRRSYYAPSGQDEDADEETLEELTGRLFEVLDPPAKIIKGGRLLLRRKDFHPALGEHWIYEEAPSAARPSPREERAEARR